MHPTLRDFIETLDAEGELRRIAEPVSPLLEITEIADRHSKRPAPSTSPDADSYDPGHSRLGGEALLFDNVEGCDFPLAINTFGSYRRMEIALGCDSRFDGGGFTAIAERIGSLTQPQPPGSFREVMAKAGEFLPLLRIKPKLKRKGVCQEVVKLAEAGEVDLMRLPLIKCWPLDGDPAATNSGMTAEEAGTAKGEGRYITFAGMHTIHADDADAAKPKSHNIGMYRAQLVDETHLAMHWHLHHDGAAHWRSWKKLGQPMPIAICFGGESVLPYAATAPLPPGISELLMAGYLNGGGIPMVRAKTVPLRVPANSEIVIEGYVDTRCGSIGYDPRDGEPLGPGAVFEGPFGDHTGFYSLPDRYPLLTVTAITHRANAIFPATIVGLPPQEDYYLGKATERIFLPLLKTLIPDVIDYHLPRFSCFHNCAFIKIRKTYPHQARRVMCSVWGAGQMAWTKMIVVVDDDVDVHDEPAVLKAMFERCHFVRDVQTVMGPLDILDHASPYLGAGGKIGFDATRSIPGESVDGVPHDAAPQPLDLPSLRSDLRGLVGEKLLHDIAVPDFGRGRCVFVAVSKKRAGDGRRAIERIWETTDRGADFVIAVDASVDVEQWEAVLFALSSNADPVRDRMTDHHGRMAIDATPKQPEDALGGYPVRDFPPVLKMDPDVAARIDERASAFGL